MATAKNLNYRRLMVTMQAPEPTQAPPQPLKVEPLAGAAVKVTAVPLARLAEQLDPQSMPPVLDVTVPLPDRVTLSE